MKKITLIILFFITLIGLWFGSDFLFNSIIVEDINDLPEIINDEDLTEIVPVPDRPEEDIDEDLPKVAIIIDDLGYNFELDKQFLSLDQDITVAVLPFLNDSREIAELMSERFMVILHMPMEPIDENQKEERMLLSDMNSLEISNLLDQAIADIGVEVVGLNNHKGSKFTANREVMNNLMSEIKKRNLFFVDSFTIGSSVGIEVADDYNVPAIKRDIFLDNKRDEEAIRIQLLEAINIAKEKGQAVAIGHSYPETLSVLKRNLPLWEKEVNFVSIIELLDN